MTVPLVSVCITTYNYAHFLEETVKSVLNQTFSDFELIISDNNSTDDTDNIVQQYLQDQRVSYYKNTTNLGIAGNWNKCLGYAKGKYIKFLCADDQFSPELLERFVGVMEQYPDVSLVTSYRQAFENSTVIIKVPLSGWHRGQEIINHTLNTYGWLGEPSAVMIRKDNLYLGPFRTDVIWLIDAEMWLRHLTAGNCYIIPEPLACIRIHQSQVTTKVMYNFVNYFEEYYLCKAIKEHKGYTIDTSGIDMEAIVKMRAAKCAKVMYKVLPQLYKKSKWQIFKHAFKIAGEEHVIVKPLAMMVKKFLKQKS